MREHGSRSNSGLTVALVLIPLLATLLVIADRFVGSASALFTSRQFVPNNTFNTRNLVAPSNLTATTVGHDVQLGWSPGQNGNGYAILGAANGSNSNCSGATFSGIGSTAGTNYTDGGRYLPQGNWFCYQVQTSYGTWTSQQNNPIAATQIGFFASTVQISNGGTPGVLDSGDQIVVNFNQAVNAATGPTASDTVCPSYFGILLASATASGSCDTAVFRVGSFSKSTGAAPSSQTIAHQLGTTPKALILWTNGKTDESFTPGFLFAFGVTDGATSRAIAAASDDVVNKSDASTRLANKALTIAQWGEILLAEADLSSWDASNFTLNWTTNDAQPYIVHYIAIGGTGVSAKVVDWTMAIAPGNKAVTGVGFQPDVVIHAFPDSTFVNAPPATLADATVGIGAMDANGNQWTNFIFSRDNRGTSDTHRGQKTNATLFAFTSAALVTKQAAFVSMDIDGFTVNFSVANNSASRVFSLALRGVNAHAGSFAKGTGAAPASQSVTGVGFQPRAVLLSSFQDVAQSSPVVQSRFGIGASDAASEASSAYTDANGVGTMNVKGIDKSGKVFIKVDNNTPVVDAEADLTGMDADGFTLNWTTNDAVATQLLYLALAPRTAPAESLNLGQLSGGLTSGCNCRYSATYAWSNSNKTLTVTIGARLVGYTNPTLSSATRTFAPTANAARLQSSSGSFHVCDNNNGGGNCLPTTNSLP